MYIQTLILLVSYPGSHPSLTPSSAVMPQPCTQVITLMPRPPVWHPGSWSHPQPHTCLRFVPNLIPFSHTNPESHILMLPALAPRLSCSNACTKPLMFQSLHQGSHVPMLAPRLSWSQPCTKALMVPALHPGSHAPSLAPRLSCSQPCTNHHSFLPLTNSLHVLLVFSLFNLPTSLVTRLLSSGFCPQSLSHNLCTGVQDPTSYLGSLSYQVSWSQASHPNFALKLSCPQRSLVPPTLYLGSTIVLIHPQV